MARRAGVWWDRSRGESRRRTRLDEVGDEGPLDPAPSADLVPVDDAGIGEGPGLASVHHLAGAGREEVAQPVRLLAVPDWHHQRAVTDCDRHRRAVPDTRLMASWE